MSAISPIVQQMRGPLDITPQETAQQNKAAYLTAGKETSRAVGDSLTGENSLEVPAGNDTVTISEKARALQRGEAAQTGLPAGEDAAGTGKTVDAGGLAAGESPGKSSAADIIAELRRQIQEIQKQIAQAKQRLSQTGDPGGAAQSAAGESGQAAEGGAKSDAAETPEGASQSAAPDGAGGAEGKSSEAESIESEINTLEIQLQTLQYKLMEMSQGKTGGAAMGTAGIGGAADGPSGQGERISVSA